MKLPNSKNCIIDDDKILKYLFNKSNPVSFGKAYFFNKIGFNEFNYIELKEILFEFACNNEIEKIIESLYGIKYIIIGEIVRNSKTYFIETIWIVENNTTIPRFITAYPKEV